MAGRREVRQAAFLLSFEKLFLDDDLEKIFEGDSYSFTVKGSILAPIVTYLIFCVIMFILNRIGGKKKKNKE